MNTRCYMISRELSPLIGFSSLARGPLRLSSLAREPLWHSSRFRKVVVGVLSALGFSRAVVFGGSAVFFFGIGSVVFGDRKCYFSGSVCIF